MVLCALPCFTSLALALRGLRSDTLPRQGGGKWYKACAATSHTCSQTAAPCTWHTHSCAAWHSYDTHHI
eukprot:3987322-Alexandrium_andersonii.AAC.1